MSSNFAVLKKKKKKNNNNNKKQQQQQQKNTETEIVFNLSKGIIWAYKEDGFLLFLKAFSWETDLWVTQGDFTVKKCKIGKGNLYLTANRLS